LFVECPILFDLVGLSIILQSQEMAFFIHVYKAKLKKHVVCLDT